MSYGRYQGTDLDQVAIRSVALVPLSDVIEPRDHSMSCLKFGREEIIIAHSTDGLFFTLHREQTSWPEILVPAFDTKLPSLWSVLLLESTLMPVQIHRQNLCMMHLHGSLDLTLNM